MTNKNQSQKISGKKSRLLEILPGIGFRAAVLIGAAVIMGLLFNSVNPNGIPLHSKNSARILRQELAPSTNPESQSGSTKHDLRNETKSVTLIRGSSDKDDDGDDDKAKK